MGAIETEHIYGLQLRENANDGSDFATPDADYRTAFIGEDGRLYYKTATPLVVPLAAHNKWDATTAPTADDDSGDGYSVGSRWIDVTNDKEYVCLDATLTAAVWTETTGAGGSAAFYGARVSRTATQAITTATFTAVQFTAADEVDTNGLHDPASNPQNVTIPTGGDGYYDIGAWVSYANSTAGTFRLARLLKNGTPISEVSMPFHTDVGTNGQLFAGAVSLVATDVITVDTYQNSGGNLNLNAARLSVSRIGT